MDIVSLVHRVLSGEASGSEKQKLKDWIAESKANREEYENIKLLWEYSSAANDQYRDDDNGFEKIRQRVREHVRRKSRILYLVSTVILVVAMVICFLLLKETWLSD